MNRDELFQEYRPLLFSIAYQMLGSAMDADDCLQEAYMRWHTALERGEVIQSAKTYLCTIVTHLCIDQMRSARARREMYVGVWLPEPLVASDATDPAEMTDFAESLSMALFLLLERLSPVERAVFLLRQAFDYEYAEIAQIVGKSEENCRQIVRRARQHVNAGHAHRQVSLEQREQLTQQFYRACMSGDMEGLLSLLAKDVVMHSDGGGKVHAARNPIYGADKVARGLMGIVHKMSADLVWRATRVNGQPGFVAYLNALAVSVVYIEIGEDGIQEIDIVVNPDKLRQVPPPSVL
jgi:RNA polymerase sigma-70 factor (ECF subfamily)